MSICPGCQIGTLEPFGGKVCCNNTRCHYTETCSDGGCMVGSDILETHPFQTCPKCDRGINTLAIQHHCIDPNAPRLVDEPPSTAASDFELELMPQQPLNISEIFKKDDSLVEFNNKNRPPKIYLSGPMTGLPNLNKTEFDKYELIYRDRGFAVVNPAAHLDLTIPYEDHIRRDVRALLEDGIGRVYLLPGWQKSKGANLEVHLSKMFKIPLYDAESGEPYRETIVGEAERLVYGDRRESYANPLADFGRTAGIINAVFRHKLKREFTAQDVALMMIAVKLSRLTNKPDHRDSCVDIAGYAECYWWCGELLDEMRSMPN